MLHRIWLWLDRLSDEEYEALFLQIIDRVSQEQWGQAQVLAYLGKRVDDPYFLHWLHKFGERLLMSSTNPEIATRMVRLGEIGCGELGRVAQAIGTKLLAQCTSTIPKTVPELLETEADNMTNTHADLPFGEAEYYFKQGLALADSGQYEEAVVSYSKAIQIKPDYCDAWSERGDTLLFELENYGEALANYDKVLEFKPDQHGAWINRGRALLELGRDEEATASFDKVLGLKPEDHEDWNNRGRALASLKRYEEALESCNRAIELKPDYYKSWHSRGRMLDDLERYEEALADFDKALELKPNHHTWNNRGNSLLNLERYQEAIVDFDKALELKPDYYNAWNGKGVALRNLERYEEAFVHYDKALEFKPDYHHSWRNRGDALQELERYEEALVQYDKAIELKPDYYSAWNGKGITLHYLKRYEEAIAHYNKALEFKPDYHYAWNNKGFTLHELERYEEALADFDKALELKPNYHTSWSNRGLALSGLGRYEEAIRNCDKAVDFKSNSPETWNSRGMVLDDLGYYEEAIASYNKALKLKPSYHYAWNNRGVSLKNLNRSEEAIASYDKALEFSPNYHHAWINRGNALRDLGRYEEAIQHYDRAIEIRPGYHLVWRNRGLALQRLGRYKEAIRSYDRALSLKPSYWGVWIIRGKAASSSFERESVVFRSIDKPGYEGELANYNEGLKHVLRDKHSEGWGWLHQAIGKAHRSNSRFQADPTRYLNMAMASYEKACETLTPEAFPEAHLTVLEDLIPVYRALGQVAKAEGLRQRGSELLEQLINESNSPGKQRRLAEQFRNFRRVTVDALVRSNQLTQALEIAEGEKNSFLTWFLYTQIFKVLDTTYREIQQILNPTTAIVYWHLSPTALTTFVLKHNAPKPRLIASPTTSHQSEYSALSLNRLLRLEDWIGKWDEQYADYGSTNRKDERRTHSWREGMESRLWELRDILNIAAIEQELEGIRRLILIPHRDLHRFPLHALFTQPYIQQNYTTTYLPSAQVGLTLLNKGETTWLQRKGNAYLSRTTVNQLLSIENPKSQIDEGLGRAKKLQPLLYAEVESEVVCQKFSQPTRLGETQAGREQTLNLLKQPHRVFHFTGHGFYESSDPTLSALCLSGTDRLTLKDMMEAKLDLSFYQLVCLSACETAVTGNQTVTSEYVGLVSGFMGCGVAHVVSTLWTVESASTTLVMIEFYNQLLTGKTIVDALNTAQKWLRDVTGEELVHWCQQEIDNLLGDDAGKLLVREFLQDWQRDFDQIGKNAPYAHPYYWAAFTVTGL